MNAPIIIWFRQDLRLEDNPALTAAASRNAPIIPLYIWNPEEEDKWPLGRASKWWLHHSLKSMESRLDSFKLPLVIRKGNSLDCLLEIIKETQASAVLWNRRYEPACIARDAMIKTELHSKGIFAESFNANLLYEPWTISNKQGRPFQVFTPFWKACLVSRDPPPPLPIPSNLKKYPLHKHILSIPIEKLALLPTISWDAGIRKTWKPGEKEAYEYLHRFLEKEIREYTDQRDFPSLNSGTSHLSPHLHFGEISPRTIWHAARQKYGNNTIIDPYLRQLGWREFAHHLLFHFPETPETPLKRDFHSFGWKINPQGLKAWQQGLTGYPLVDAGMRELWATGWMHNRVRMVVGSFLVKDLLINWTEGARWFWDTLVDADLANNTLGWQWIGGCGADAAPYFRIFHPVTQSEKFDPEGIYLKKWIPEIAHIPLPWIHKPWEAPEMILRKAGVRLGKTYPHPIVDHKTARNEALAAFAARS